eukprot:Blabericola_migrator_1__6375@NODE_3212_length_1947_cov_12_673404_g2010_i0_p2_GENE_NODE_3212_length_1947_cov_12_673404_g2010_i0NODE_3212_length_1947_cov_12_673404_g2010_i0_p2_ORF_typecomplete_len109_score5_03_NODE_3212_length_1947_cov_12_673404_g2010_i011141440
MPAATPPLEHSLSTLESGDVTCFARYLVDTVQDGLHNMTSCGRCQTDDFEEDLRSAKLRAFQHWSRKSFNNLLIWLLIRYPIYALATSHASSISIIPKGDIKTAECHQ